MEPPSHLSSAQIHISFVTHRVDIVLDAEWLYSLLKKLSNVLSVVIKAHCKEDNEKKQHGYGFGFYASVEDAMAAVTKLQKTTYEGITYDCHISKRTLNQLHRPAAKQLMPVNTPYGMPMYHRPNLSLAIPPYNMVNNGAAPYGPLSPCILPSASMDSGVFEGSDETMMSSGSAASISLRSGSMSPTMANIMMRGAPPQQGSYASYSPNIVPPPSNAYYVQAHSVMPSMQMHQHPYTMPTAFPTAYSVPMVTQQSSNYDNMRRNDNARVIYNPPSPPPNLAIPSAAPVYPRMSLPPTVGVQARQYQAPMQAPPYTALPSSMVNQLIHQHNNGGQYQQSGNQGYIPSNYDQRGESNNSNSRGYGSC
eukprot:gene4140-4544_t